jgi:AcrR family transcriptional regulator
MTEASAAVARSTRRQRSPRGRGAVLRDELVRAATALLDRTDTPDTVTIRAVAAEVGVAPTAIYLHFADRDELMVTVVEERFAEFQRAIDAADAGEDPLDALVARGEAYVRFALAHPGHYRALFGGLSLATERPDLVARCQAAGAPAFQALIDAVQRGLDAGRLHGSDPYPIAVALWSTVHGYADLSRTCRPMLPDVRDVLQSLVAAFQPAASRRGSVHR